MKEFNIVSSCDICGEQEAIKEMTMKNEEAMYEVYEDMIRSSY